MDDEDLMKDIDFTPSGVRARWSAGRADTLSAIERAPWSTPVDPIEGVVVHGTALQEQFVWRRTSPHASAWLANDKES